MVLTSVNDLLEFLCSNRTSDRKGVGVVAGLGWGVSLVELTLVNELVESLCSGSEWVRSWKGTDFLGGRSRHVGNWSCVGMGINLFIGSVVHHEDLRKCRSDTSDPILNSFLGRQSRKWQRSGEMWRSRNDQGCGGSPGYTRCRSICLSSNARLNVFMG